MQPDCVKSLPGDKIPCLMKLLIGVNMEVIIFRVSAKRICSMKLLVSHYVFCNPLQSCVPWTVAAMGSAQEGYASVKRAGWDPPARSALATRTVLSTASAKMGSVSAALDGKGTTAPSVRVSFYL